MTFVGPVPVSVIKQAVSWSKYNSCWDMSLCKQPSATLDANSASTTLSMIGSESNRIRRDRSRIRFSRRHFRTYRGLELRNVTDTAGHLSGKPTFTSKWPALRSREAYVRHQEPSWQHSRFPSLIRPLLLRYVAMDADMSALPLDTDVRRDLRHLFLAHVI